MALRRPILHKVLDYEDEFFAMLMFVLETHSMRTTGNLCSTSFYFTSLCCANNVFSLLLLLKDVVKCANLL